MPLSRYRPPTIVPKFDHSADTFVRFKVSDSLAQIPDVSNMVEDNEKYLWLQTSNGMMSINPAE